MINFVSTVRGTFLPAVVTVCVLASAPMVHAQSSDESSIKVSGFLSLVGGQAINSSLGNDYVGLNPINSVDCPCYIADWSNGGVYGKTFSLAPESRAGIQANYKLNDKASLVAQVVVRGTNGTPDLTWAYAGYKIANGWEVQVGRKRIPLYYYSDFQDIGVAYPWVGPPPELYGWDATNYNGASLRYTGSWGESSVASSVFAGREDIDKSLYWKLYGSSDTKVTWSNILGADLEWANGPLTVRGVYMTADVQTNDTPAALAAYGIAANLDYDTWFVLAEVTKLTRKSALIGNNYDAPAATIGVGMRLGKWTPFLNYAQYVEVANDAVWAPTEFRRTSATLRYEVDASSGIKVQLDRNQDVTRNMGGDATVFRLAYDRVF